MKRIYLYIGLALLGGLVLAALGTGTLSFADASCSWQVLEIDGQQFGSMDELRQAADAHGANFDQLQNRFDFQDPADGPVAFKAIDCGTREVTA